MATSDSTISWSQSEENSSTCGIGGWQQGDFSFFVLCYVCFDNMQGW